MKPLIDSFGRRHTYLRISVTDRCNLRCVYCTPPEGIEWKTREEMLSLEELARLARLFAQMGVTKIRLTGGEPLTRSDIERLISDIVSIPTIETLGITTNGVLLKDKVNWLKRAGVTHLNVSLDTLRPRRFERLTGADHYHTVRNAIEAAIEVGFCPVKLNVVVIGGCNDDEIVDFVEFVQDKPLCLRFIEYMPFQDNGWCLSQFISAAEMKAVIQERYRLIPQKDETDPAKTAKEYRIDGFVGTVGFITSLSDHFCDTCNRIRLTADGSIISCLHHPAQLNLREAMRGGASDDELGEMIHHALQLKPPGHASVDQLAGLDNRTMIEVGG